MQKYDIDVKNYLDLACGTGNVTVEIASDFKEIYAVDLSEDMLREAERKFKKVKK